MTGFNSKRDAAADKLQEPVREALKLALEAMEYMAKIRDCQREAGYPLSDADKGLQKAITAIKEALAQPEQEPVCNKDPHGCWNVRCQLGKQCKNLAQPAQEPVAWMYQCTADNSGPVLLRHRTNWAESNSGLWTETPLYTAPPQRPWVGLTDSDFCRERNTDDFIAGAFFAEAKLKERNHGA